MPNDIKVTKETSHVLVEVEGEYSLDKAKEIMSTVAKSCEEHRCFKAILDARKLKVVIDEIDKIHILESTRPALINIEKLAIIATEEQRDPTKFFEMAAASRGIIVKIFVDKYVALEWLVAS